MCVCARMDGNGGVHFAAWHRPYLASMFFFILFSGPALFCCSYDVYRNAWYVLWEDYFLSVVD